MNMPQVIGCSIAGGALFGWGLAQAYIHLGSNGFVASAVVIGGLIFAGGTVYYSRKGQP